MVQSAEESMNKVCLLTLLSEAHIWDRVTLGTPVGAPVGEMVRMKVMGGMLKLAV